MRKRHYQRHTTECGGIDPVAIQIIVHAGTVDVLPIDHLICDCERAYIVTHTPKAEQILRINGLTRKRLVDLWHTIETSEDTDEIVYNNH